MATAQTRPHLAGSNEIKLEPGVAQTFALKFVTGKNLGDSQFPPYMPRVLFTAIDDRRLYLDAEDASSFEIRLRELGVRPADFIRAIRIRKGGGIAVERVADVDSDPDTHPDMRRAARTPAQPRTPSREEALLEKSVEIARERGPAAFITPKPEGPITITPASSQMCAAMCAAVDAIIETQAYAQRRGLGVTFSEESVRAIGLSIFIQGARR